MADTVLIYAGKKESMPKLTYRILGYCYDTKELYIGGAGSEENLLIGSVTWGRDIDSLKIGLNNHEKALDLLGEEITSLKDKDSEAASAYESINAELKEKLTAKKAEGVASLGDSADLSETISSINAIISSLKTAGIMTT